MNLRTFGRDVANSRVNEDGPIDLMADIPIEAEEIEALMSR